MGYIIRRLRLKNGQRKEGLREIRRRVAKSWKVRCPSIRQRRRCVKGALLLLAASIMVRTGVGRGIARWVREQIPHVVQIKGSSPAQAADRDGMTSVKRGFTIRLDEREIHIYQVEEGYEDHERSGDSGSG